MEKLFTVRFYDKFDHGWIDCIGAINVTKEKAQEYWNKETSNGTRHASSRENQYYAIFPANTRMLYEADDDD